MASPPRDLASSASNLPFPALPDTQVVNTILRMHGYMSEFGPLLQQLSKNTRKHFLGNFELLNASIVDPKLYKQPCLGQLDSIDQRKLESF